MAIKATKEAKTFYTMLAMLKCAEQLNNYLNQFDSVGGNVKKELRALFNRLEVMQVTLTKDLPKDDLKKWEDDWNRDYMSFAMVFEQMTEMDDQKREAMEVFGSDLIAGRISIVNEENTAA